MSRRLRRSSRGGQRRHRSGDSGSSSSTTAPVHPPSGRTRRVDAGLVLEVEQLRRAARAASTAALERLVAIGKRTEVHALEAAVAANRAIIELAWGRPR